MLHNQSRKSSQILKKNTYIKKEKLVDVFDPVNHQKLPVMFYSFCQESNNAPSFCVEPRYVVFSIYKISYIGDKILIFSFKIGIYGILWS